MSTSSKYQRLRASSKITKKNSTIIYLEIAPRKIQKPHSTSLARKFLSKCTVSADSRTICAKVCRSHAPNENLPIKKFTRRNSQQKTRMIKKLVNRFATQTTWLVSRRDGLQPKGISKQTEFCFAVFEQALVDNRRITYSMYNLFDRCNFYKVYMGSVPDTKT